jgi:hypothetical protein
MDKQTPYGEERKVEEGEKEEEAFIDIAAGESWQQTKPL